MVARDRFSGLYPVLPQRLYNQLQEIVAEWDDYGVMDLDTLSTLSREELMKKVDELRHSMTSSPPYEDPEGPNLEKAESKGEYRRVLGNLQIIYSYLRRKTGGPEPKTSSYKILENREYFKLLSIFRLLQILDPEEDLPDSVPDILNMIEESKDLLKDRDDISSRHREDILKSLDSSKTLLQEKYKDI